MSDVNFVQLVEHITESGKNQWGHKQLAIWGGTCRPDEVEAMLKKWELPNNGGMSYCIWETSESIGFERCPDAETTLNVADIFGAMVTCRCAATPTTLLAFCRQKGHQTASIG